MAYEDLLKDTSESFEDGNYFLVTITDLDLSKQYPLQFKWKYKDGTYGKDWSATYYITTPGSTVPNEPKLGAGDVIGGAGFISVTWDGNDSSNNPIQNIDRVDVHISGTSFGDGTKPAGSFKTSGTQTFSAEPGIYIVQLKAYRVDGASSFFSTARTVTVTAIEELIETPIVPTGFSARAILGGIEITWNGTYTGGATWSGFQAINIYAGTSTSATGGTYIKVGQMTANKVSNKIVIPIDGTYVRYGFTAYIHASSVNKATPPVESSISANVANATPSQVVNTDLIDAVISEAKLALNAVTETKIATDAITTPKIVASAITGGKIAALAITGDKIAANTIDVGKLVANTISVQNLSAGDISATSYIRAGTSGSARVEIASTTVGTVLPGLTVYASDGTTQLLRAPLTGGLTITGALTATSISTASGKFSVNSGGVMSATGGSFGGSITADGGTIGGIVIAADAIQNGVNSGSSTFRLDSAGKARFGSTTNSIIINPSSTVGALAIYHSTDGSSSTGTFSISNTGILTAVGASFKGTITNDTSGDFWNNDGSFRFGGSTGITRGSGATATVSIGGNVTISGSLTAAAIGIDSENYWNNTGNSGKFRVGGASKYIYWNGSTLDINGKVTADDGQIGPWVIDAAGYLRDSGDTTRLAPSGTIGSTAYAILTNRTLLAKAINLGTITQTGGPNTGEMLISGTSAPSGYALTIQGDSSLSSGKTVIYNDGYVSFNGGSISVNGSLSFGNPAVGLFEFFNTTGNIRAGLAYSNAVSGRTVLISSTNILGTSASTIRKKHEIEDYQINEDALLSLNLKAFKFKPEYDELQEQQYGFIAEEAEDLGLTELIQYDKDGLVDYFDYARLPAFLLQIIKNQKQKIKQIESRLDALEG